MNYLKATIKIIKDNGCDPLATNNLKETCYHKAAKYSYFDLIKALLESGCGISDSVNEDGNTILHLIVTNSPKKCDMLLPSLRKANDFSILKSMAKIQNKQKQTPLVAALMNYKSLTRNEQNIGLIEFLVNDLDSNCKAEVPLDDSKSESCLSFAIKHCSQELVSIIQNKFDQNTSQTKPHEVRPCNQIEPDSKTAEALEPSVKGPNEDKSILSSNPVLKIDSLPGVEIKLLGKSDPQNPIVNNEGK